MASQAAVHNPSSDTSDRSDSSQSNIANGIEHESIRPDASSSHTDQQFPSARSDASLYRASRRSFEIHVNTLQRPSEPGPSDETRQSPQLPDGIDQESDRSDSDPFPEQTTSTIRADPTSPTSVYEDDGPPSVPPLQPGSMPTQRSDAAPQPTSQPTPPTSELPPSTQSPSLPAPIPAFDDQRANSRHILPTQIPSTSPPQQASPSAPPNTTTPPHPQSIQPITSANSQTHNHHPPNPRDRRRRRFVRWIRQRFRRQLPWLEGWLHRREGSQRQEAPRAVRNVEDVGL